MISSEKRRQSQDDGPRLWKNEWVERAHLSAFATVPNGTSWLGRRYLLWRSRRPLVLDALSVPGTPDQTRRILSLSWLLAWSVTVSCLLTTTAQAEWYVGGYGGISVPGSLGNVTVSDPTLAGGVSNARIDNLELKSGLLEGIKGGYFLESRPWLGIETDLYTLKPDVKQQTVVGGTSSGQVFATSIPTTSLRLSVLAANLVIRSPSMSEVFQPYGGIGYGLFFATGSKGGQSTQISPGFQFIAGARYVLTPEWALFGEFKYNNSTIRFSGIKGNWDSQNFVAGLMYHFGR